MKPSRQIRLGEQLKRELGDLLGPTSNEFRHLMITVTEVKLSADYRYADVWVSTLEEGEKRKQIVAYLGERAGYVRHLLGQRMHLRYIPELRFYPDNTLERAARIDQILHREGLI